VSKPVLFLKAIQQRELLAAPDRGHGHVTPRADGAKAKCGGLRWCSVCQEEKRQLGAAKGEGRYLTEGEVRAMAREKHGTPPKAGDRIEFSSDRHTDKGPCTGDVMGVKATVDGYYVTVKFGDRQESFSWDDLRPGASKSGNHWMIKAIPQDEILAAGKRALAQRHGHVTPLPSGVKARCGGPQRCPVCQHEKTQLALATTTDPSWEQPTPAQAEAGNYYKPRMTWHGLQVNIENPVGTVREGVDDQTGKPWRTEFRYAYGEVAGTEGADGDPVDVFIGPYADAREVYIVRQMKRKKWDQYDEDKVMIDFPSIEAARDAYLGHYDDPRFFGGIVAMPVDEFVRKVRASRDNPGMIKALFFVRRKG
jgi:hypothetical protein